MKSFDQYKLIKNIKARSELIVALLELPSGKLIATGNKGNMDVYDMKDNFKHIYSIPNTNKDNDKIKITFLSNGYFIVTTDNGTIELLDIDLDKKETTLLQNLDGHESTVYDIIELSDKKLVSVSNNGQIIFWEYEPTTNSYKIFKKLNEHPNEYSQIFEDVKRNLIVCAPCFDSCGTAIIDLKAYNTLKKFDDIAGNGCNELTKISDNIILDNSAADEVGLFYIDLDKMEIIKHDENFNENKTTCFLKLKNGLLLASVTVGEKDDFKMNDSYDKDNNKYDDINEDEKEEVNEKFHSDIQTIKILDNGKNLAVFNTKSCVDYAPILSMIELSDGKIVTGSNRIKVYE